MGDISSSLRLLSMGIASGTICGRVAHVAADGGAFVDVPGADEPVAARCAVPESAIPPDDTLAGAPVLLLFEDSDPRRPVIVGFLRDRLRPAGASMRPDVTTADAARAPADRIVIEAAQSLELRCGKASILLAEDGRVVVKGTRLTSRATESNKIRGAVVLIN